MLVPDWQWLHVFSMASSTAESLVTRGSLPPSFIAANKDMLDGKMSKLLYQSVKFNYQILLVDT